MTIKIIHNNITHSINKEKLMYVLSRLASKDIEEFEITTLLRKYNLYDDYFLKTINKI